MPIFHTRSAAETFAWGSRLAKGLTAGDVLCLRGDLGAGKTLLAQGIAQGLGSRDEVASPSFTILRVYETGRLPIYHFDLYRLETAAELFDIGFEEIIAGDGVSIIEWADKFPAAMPEEALWVELTPLEAPTGREIRLRPAGERYRRLGEELMHSADPGA